MESQVVFHKGDITDPHSLAKILGEVRPSEIYHLAAQSHVSQSFETPDYTMQVNTTGTLNLLQAIIVCRLEKHTRLYNVSIHGQVRSSIRNPMLLGFAVNTVGLF